jgi:hypothetical protein
MISEINTGFWVIARADALLHGEVKCYLKVGKHIGGGFLRCISDSMTPTGATPFVTKEAAEEAIHNITEMVYDDFGQYKTIPSKDAYNYLAVEVKAHYTISAPNENGKE